MSVIEFSEIPRTVVPGGPGSPLAPIIKVFFKYGRIIMKVNKNIIDFFHKENEVISLNL